MLEASGISKTFGGVVALRDVEIVVRAGSAHALVGENGAGKSTLVKIFVGAVRPNAGVLHLGGSEVAFENTADAAAHGVAIVTQELTLFPDLDVLSNLFPKREPRRGPLVWRAEMAERARPVLAELGLDVSLRRLVGTLSLAQQQLVEIAKALVVNPQVLILDEPTSALESSGVDRLMEIVCVLRERGVAVVFVSHRLEEVMSLCDEITVLRDGRSVLRGVPRAELEIPAIVDAMLGEHRQSAPSGARKQRIRGAGQGGAAGDLRFDEVTVAGKLEEVSFSARSGEIVGLAGLAGSGPKAVLETVAGMHRPDRGHIGLPDGETVPHGLRRAIAAGVAYVTGDRKRLGLMLEQPIWENIGHVSVIALAREGFFVRTRALRARARSHVDQLGIHTSSIDSHAGSLSGGNQQKVVFAKWLDAQPMVLLLDDPTRGVDVGATVEMHDVIHRVAASDAVVLFCSTELAEFPELCDRVLVFYHQRICAELSGEELTEHAILNAMNTGVPAAQGREPTAGATPIPKA